MKRLLVLLLAAFAVAAPAEARTPPAEIAGTTARIYIAPIASPSTTAQPRIRVRDCDGLGRGRWTCEVAVGSRSTLCTATVRIRPLAGGRWATWTPRLDCHPRR